MLTLLAAACRGADIFPPYLLLAPPQPSPSGAPSFLSEKGKFKILVDGKDAGKEEFEISQTGGDWIARGISEIQTAQGTTKITGNLEFRADGTPVKYDWSTEGAKKASASIGFKGNTATIDLHVDGARPFTQQFTFNSPKIAILDNNLYHQYAVLARLYDWNKKGVQNFLGAGAAGNDSWNGDSGISGQAGCATARNWTS